MNVRIDRLILRCRGIEPSTAQAAVRELGPALLRQLREGGGREAPSGAIRVPAKAEPEALADGVAGRIAAAVENKAAANNKTEKF
jgi:hypothetical protein